MATWSLADMPSQTGRLGIVTGATSGLGYQCALALAQAGAQVILTGRNRDRGLAALEQISRQAPGAKVVFESLDLADLAAVSAFADRMRRRKRLDLLINNAGVMALPTRQTTADGFEMQFGTNYLGHFALTGQLLPMLLHSADARVVSVSSVAHRTGAIDFNDLQGARWYSPWKAYGQSKLAVLIFARELQRRSAEAGRGLTSIAAHPGWARTELFTNGPGGFVSMMSQFAAPVLGQSAAAGALPILFAATSPAAEPGAYYGPNGLGELRGAPGPALEMPQGRNAATASRLWAESVRLSGMAFEF